jgi:NAD(P)-dependent dehydrogenase (short-subunit alcohol dehydrogenase family)
VRKSVDGNEHDAHERCGRKAEDHVARHRHFPGAGLRHDPAAVPVPLINSSAQAIVPYSSASSRGSPPRGRFSPVIFGIANAVVFFASDLASLVNGQILQVDGGR